MADSELSIERLRTLSPHRLRDLLLTLSDEEAAVLYYTWELWARPKQMLPPGADWKTWLILTGRGWGKHLALNTPIPTPSGWTTMGELEPGAQVFDEAGNPCKVTAVFDSIPERAWRVHFSDGTFLDAGGEHQWVTWTHRERKAFLRSPYEDTSRFPADWPKWRLKKLPGHQIPEDVVREALMLHEKGHGQGRERGMGLSVRKIAESLSVSRNALAPHLKAGKYLARQPRTREDSPGPQIRTTDEIANSLTYGSRKDVNHCIPLALPLNLPSIDLPIDPWILGYWLGNGASNGSVLHTGSHEGETDLAHVLGKVKAAGAGYEVSGVRDLGTKGKIRIRGFPSLLKKVGLIEGKFIPAVYLRASFDQRLSLLRGLMDSDGHATKESGQCEFCSVRESLAQGVLELLRTLGEKPVMARRKSSLNGKQTKDKYVIRWRPLMMPFSLPRKQRNVRPNTGEQALRNCHRMITDCEPIQTVQMRCITVDSPNGMYLAGKAMIPTHNTRTGAETIRHWAETGQAQRMALIAPSAADARDVMVDGASGILNISPPWFRPTFITSKRRLEWPNGVIATVYSAEDPEQLRGPNHDAGWLDELCLEKGTLIQTGKGEVPIERLHAGDEVWTRKGLCKVTRAWKSSDSAEVYELLDSDGRKLVGTGNHPVWIEGQGFIPLKSLKSLLPGAVLRIWDTKSSEVKETRVSLAKVPVYNLEVEDQHEFFANGILVHNCAWAYPETYDLYQFGLRLGTNPRTIITTTPKPIKLLKDIARDPTTHLTVGSSYENRDNLAPTFFSKIVAQYEGTRLGRQELHAEIINMEEEGIIQRSWFKLYPHDRPLPEFIYIVLSLDTAFSDDNLPDRDGRRKKEGDPTACTVWGIFKPFDSPHQIMLLDSWAEKLGYPDLRSRIVEEFNYWYGDPPHKPDTALIEAKGSGISLRQDLQRAGLPCRPYNPGRDDKVMRLHAVSHIPAHGRVHIPESPSHPGNPISWAEPFISQVCTFPNDEHDDMVDTFSQVLSLLRDEGWVDLDSRQDSDGDGDGYCDEESHSRNPYSSMGPAGTDVSAGRGTSGRR